MGAGAVSSGETLNWVCQMIIDFCLVTLIVILFVKVRRL
jgi:hypothetical protein